MEFNEKLQELRKSKGLTQDQLAECLFVSRTAISKWESGRGYPNLDSLKAIAQFFSITIDELLSSNEVLKIAQETNRTQEESIQSLIYGLLDIGVALLLFLPFFAQKAVDGKIQAVSLLLLTSASKYIIASYDFVVAFFVFTGILLFTFRSCNYELLTGIIKKFSFALSIISTTMFIVTQQPYAAVFIFFSLIVKMLMLVKTK